jgi:CheY-like chemotaxis protein
MNNKSRILIADDNAANRELLEAYLVNIDCDLEYAHDGADTMEKVETFKPDLVLLDVMMPKMNGFEVCKAIRQNPEYSNTLILMVTALSERGDIERGVAAGTDDFLKKPVERLELNKRVGNLLRLKGMTDENERLRQYIQNMEEGWRREVV